jgi:DNA polymerase-3 subunit gamma/tau
VAAQEAAPAYDFRQLVALFSERREAALHAMLYGQVNLVRCEPGLLEVRVDPSLPPNFAGRIGHCLTEWTGQRWVVSISAHPGEATLAEQDKAVENARRERALAHPLMQAVFKSFPDAKLVSLKQTVVASAPANEDDDAPMPETDSLSPDFED